LTKEQSVLIGYGQTIETNMKALEQLLIEEQALADEYQKDISFANFVVALGTQEQSGKIQQLEADLQQSSPTLSGVKQADLLQVKINVEKAIADLNAKEVELKEYSEQLSYKQLYQAVIALTTVSQESCPACKTPLDQTTENPFLAAKAGLKKLEHLSILEQQRDDLKTTQHDAIKSVYEILKKCHELMIGDEKQLNLLNDNIVANDSMLDVTWWQTLIQLNENSQSAWITLEHQVKQQEAADIITSELQAARKPKAERLAELRKLYDRVIVVQTKRKTLEKDIKTANTAIATFDENNKVLIEAVKQEKSVIAQNVAVSNAYSELIRLLNSYNDDLPSKLVANLGELIVELYNAFNRGDESDLLADLKLPVSSGERIQISFQNAPKKYFDALHVLSEGHIRCIGLAILLAKNLKENCPILIFDDPVNAIDDEHREAIRRTLFEDEYFRDKQIILTCHGEEFFKDIQNLLGAKKTKESRRLTFLPQLAEKHIRIDFQSTPRNYVLAAQEHLENFEIRNALEKARQALEALTKGKVWSYVSKHGDGNLSIKLRSAKSPIELRNLTEQLKSKLSDQTFNHADKEAILFPIEMLLGINGESREWRYLNKGTHEEADRAEFDKIAVKNIIDYLISLDSILK
ncbi:MAG: hypothetical protein RLZ75_1047, partial [Pseudomonadota bacterium]